MNKASRIKLHSGNEMPVVGLGTWELTGNTAASVGYALEIGYRMIDTAFDYGSQKGIGKALQDTPVDREQIYLVAKVEENDNAFEATQSYLGEMRQDYADLVLIHRPPSEGAGRELWEGLAKAKEAGLTKDIGVSNYTTELMDQLTRETGQVPVVNQIEWSPFGYSEEMKRYCDEKQIIIQAYSPLTRTNRLHEDVLEKLGRKYEKTPAQIMLRWNLQLGTIPLPKANRRNHMEENMAIFDFRLEEEDMKILRSLNEEYSALGQLQYV